MNQPKKYTIYLSDSEIIDSLEKSKKQGIPYSYSILQALKIFYSTKEHIGNVWGIRN